MGRAEARPGESGLVALDWWNGNRSPYMDASLSGMILGLTLDTRPEDIFLSDTLISHPILFSGRRVFLGNTLFAWTSGYDVPSREAVHRRMLTTQDINELRQLLSQYHISYAAFDDGVRENQLLKGNNENLFRQNFELVFNDTENKYRNLKIYRVTASPSVP